MSTGSFFRSFIIMAVLLRILLILTFKTGIHSIKTISQVAVKAGAPVIIPCLYESEYRNQEKYLCKGNIWNYCSYETKTNNKQISQKYSISEDKDQMIFTVTMKQLADKNTFYWCAVEIHNGLDAKQYFYIKEERDPPSLYVDNQMVMGFIGEKITINCHYTTNGEIKWCKLNSNCVTEGSGSIDGTRVNLNNRDYDRFTVTLSGLRPESRGWYYCAKGDFQMPVHLTVTEKPKEVYPMNEVSNISVKAGDSVSVPCLYDSKYKGNYKYLCEEISLSSCSSKRRHTPQNSGEDSASHTNSETIFTVNITAQTGKNTRYWCAVKTDDSSDIGHSVLLYVVKGTGPSSLYVDNQMVTGFIGEKITINCHYTTNGEMKWCKMGKKCVTEESGSIDGTRVALNKRGDNRFTVTLSGLSPESSGWYYCGKGDFQMPVHLTVTEKPTVASTVVTEVGAFTSQGKTTVLVTNEQNRFSDSLSLIIPLSLLIIIVVVVLFIWFKLRHEGVQTDSATTEPTEKEVTYSDVHFKKTKAAQGLSAATDERVTYSCVVTAKKQRSEDTALDVIYSTVACQKENI